ncbi:hypothetical protein ILUMI_12406 [Ignelater luminosus]|uniref:PiggyBac transposable element-derived protein domain-containing protein n=1 Tax=Ignelater luminosus TaxID=2038154 RepID=A0A8K0CU73_IGNLU|nr:hypothetical protein ILUMI_12406 [Ignelater luminosus]
MLQMSRRYLTQKELESEMNVVSEDDEEELEDPYYKGGSFDEDYCPTENDVEDSSQSGEESHVPNMNSNRNDLEDNNETSSNSGENTTTEVKRTMKDGTRRNVPCPAMLQFYNANMSGVDLTNQIVGLHDFDRRSGGKRTKTQFLPFLIQVAEGLVSLGRNKAAVKRRSATSPGRPPKVKK